MLSADDEITGSENMISLDEVTARLKALRPFHVEDTRVPESAVADPTVAAFATEEEAEDHIAACGPEVQAVLEVVEYSDESEELAELRDLEAEMRAHTGGQGGQVTALRESYLEEFVQDEAADIGGIGPDSYLFGYVRWASLAQARTIDMSPVTFRGSEYWITT
jgi:hypothetical protein